MRALFALTLAVLMSLLPLTVGAEGYLTGKELIEAVYNSNMHLNTFGESEMDVSYSAQPYEFEEFADLNAKAVEVTAGLSTDREKAEAPTDG